MKEEFRDRDSIRQALQARNIPGLAIGFMLDEAAAKGAFRSRLHGVTVTFRKGKWQLVTKD